MHEQAPSPTHDYLILLATRSCVNAGMRMLGIVGMVGGHPNARSISLKQWAHSPLQEDDFTALILAISQVGSVAMLACPILCSRVVD